MLNLKFKNSKWQPVEWVADSDISLNRNGDSQVD